MSAPATLAPGRHVLVPSRCTVRFMVRAFGLPVRGTIDVRSGEVRTDVAGADVSATLDAAGFRTLSSRRDRDVRSARFLDTEHHSDILFTGRWAGPGSRVVGRLTVKGVSAPLDLEIVTVVTTARGTAVRARAQVDRRAFPVGPRSGPIGRRLDVEVEVAMVAP